MDKLSDYFSHNDLACKGNNVRCLDPRFEYALLLYRQMVNIPLYPNSCCRSLEHNKEVSGSEKSFHLYEGVKDGRTGTMAIDLRVTDSAVRAKMVRYALNLGWSLKIYDTFIHIDRRVDLGYKQIIFT